MPSKLPFDLHTYVAWRFDRVLDGTFRRNKADFSHHNYPVIAPLPTAGRNTSPLESSRSDGPYVYFVCDAEGIVHYVGKSLEDHVIQRWVRPGIGGPAKYYWTHSTKSGGAVFEIARGLVEVKSPYYELRYVPVSELSVAQRNQYGVRPDHTAPTVAALAETWLIRTLAPDWNSH